MTSDEKRQFVSKVQTDLAEAAEAKAKEFMRISIGAKGMSFLVLIAPEDKLDSLYDEAVKTSALLVGEQLNGVLKAAGVAAPILPGDSKTSLSGWEMP